MKKKNPTPPQSMPFTRPSRDLGYPAGFIDEGREIIAQERQGARETTLGTRLPLDGTTGTAAVQHCEAKRSGSVLRNSGGDPRALASHGYLRENR